MKERGSGFVVIVRVIVGMAVIFFINQFLESQGMDRTVGINLVSFLTSGFLGLPGVALLYGILLWEIL